MEFPNILRAPQNVGVPFYKPINVIKSFFFNFSDREGVVYNFESLLSFFLYLQITISYQIVLLSDYDQITDIFLFQNMYDVF